MNWGYSDREWEDGNWEKKKSSTSTDVTKIYPAMKIIIKYRVEKRISANIAYFRISNKRATKLTTFCVNCFGYFRFSGAFCENQKEELYGNCWMGNLFFSIFLLFLFVCQSFSPDACVSIQRATSVSTFIHSVFFVFFFIVYTFALLFK